MAFFYRAFGLSMASELELPGLPAADPPPDVEIRRGAVPESMDAPGKNGYRFQIKPGHLLMRMDGIARFEVTGGNRVIVQPEPGAKEEDIRVFLLGSVLGALLHQRHLLPLHASAICAQGGCMIFCGPSGSGKSTIANALVRRGYFLHSDDICVVAPDESGQPIAFAGYPGFKLWEDSLLKSGEDPSSYSRLRDSLNKYAVPVNGRFCAEPLPIKKIYQLAPHNNEEIRLREMTGMERFNALRSQTYKFKFVKFMGGMERYFKLASRLADLTPMVEVNRPIRPFRLEALADVLEKDFSG